MNSTGETEVGLLDNFERKKEVAGGEAHERLHIRDKIADRYEIYDIKGGEGKSGFGVVYICYDNECKVPLAIKTFQEKFLFSQKIIDDFVDEAYTWIKLGKHKNIVKALKAEIIEGRPYILMEYVAGGNLEEWLCTNQLGLPLALNLAIQFCGGMEYAYKNCGLIHRDIKPSNILLTIDNTVKITDFGLAKIKADVQRVTAPFDVSYIQSSIIGTKKYMAPELFNGKKNDTRTDIYAFGIVLYQMIAGSYPYSKKSSWREMHVKESPLPIKLDIPLKLNALIHKCLEKEPRKRYKDFSELKQEISTIYFDLTGERIIEESQQELEAWEQVNKGVSLHNVGRLLEAIECYDMALQINPRYAAEAWNNKGNALDKLGKLQDAIECFKRALEINPRYATAWNNKGSAMDRLSKSQDAIEYYDKALEINPKYVEAWCNKGVALNKLGKSQEAIECYDKVFEINQKDSVTWFDKGFLLDNAGKFQDAIECYDMAIEINPRYAEAWINKGVVLDKLGKFQEAIECYDIAIEINLRDVGVWYNKGNALDKLGKFQEAIECYDMVLEINPIYTDAWINKGATLHDIGRFQEAIECCDKAIEINPRFAEAWNTKGNALDKLGRFQEATECYDNSLKINSGNVITWNNKGIALDKLGEHQEALGCYDKAIGVNPKYADAWFNKGAGLVELGRLNEARLSFEKFIEFALPQHASSVKEVEGTIRQLKRMNVTL